LTSFATFRPALSMANQRFSNDAVPHSQSDSLSEESDEMLMARICQADQAALGSLFRRYARIVRGVAYKVLRDSSEADDLLQDIFLLIYRLSGKFDPSRGTVRFWILMMTHHRAIMRRRYLTSRHFYTYLDLEEEVDGSSHSFATLTRNANAHGEIVEKRDTLRSWFEELSENQRETLVLFFFEGYSFEEIAAKLGQTIGNARNHYYRALERLRRKMLAERTVEVRRA
jgi:RNA polymerase sigma-70 factor (ECF subfamily)